MWYILIFLIVIIGLYGFNMKQDSSKEVGKETTFSQTNSFSNPQDPLIKRTYSKQDIEAKLSYLAKTDSPQIINHKGAMCYKPASLPKTVDYVCPKCGEKTIYKSNSHSKAVQFIEWELPKCRIIAKRIKGIKIYLDESKFCKNCSPNIETPELCLTVDIKGTDKTKDSSPISSVDLQLIDEFLSGKLVHKGRRDQETPLKEYIDHLENLLGIELKEEK